MAVPVDEEELRLAAVMDGGSSLAIWIGGVNREIHRVCTAKPGDPGPYGALLGLTQTTARADVIAGTSAGGLNGAFLALALARGGDLASLASLWADQGSFSKLLRPAMQSDPPSLLQGDDYFLPELQAALQKIWESGKKGGVSPADVPIHLMITATAMQGQRRPFHDDYGNLIVEAEHRLLFEFQRDAQGTDHFAQQSVVGRLALAARSTASFPAAFEPSFVPVDETQDALHPDMKGFIGLECSSFLLDGGVLVNRPIAPALEAIFAQPAETQVRRVLLFIEPDPGQATAPVPDTYEKPPTLRTVMLDTLSGLPRAESVAASLREIAKHNQAVRERRTVRSNIEAMVAVRDGADLAQLAAALFPAYRRHRREQVMRQVLEAGWEALARPADPAPGQAPGWTEWDLMAAAGAARLPLLPPEGGETDGQAGALAEAPVHEWGAGFAERLVYTGLDLLRRASWVAPVDDESLRAELRDARRELHELAATVRTLRAAEDTLWADLAAALLPVPASGMRASVAAPDGAAAALEETAWGLAASVTASAGELAGFLSSRYDLFRRIERSEPPVEIYGRQDKVEKLGCLLDAVYGHDRDSADSTGSAEHPGAEALLARLRQVDVLFVLFAPEVPVEQRVELLQLSGHTPNTFGGPTDIGQKVTGTRTGHFAAFYKPSWRVNDWIWGRLDGAMRLTQVLLHPGRMRQMGLRVDAVIDGLRTAAVPTTGPDVPYLSTLFDDAVDACERELAFLEDEQLPVPASLPVCTDQVARRLQAEILRDELDRLASAVDQDDKEGALGDGAGPAFRARYQAALSRYVTADAIPADALFDLFAECRIGRETIMGDAGSDLFARTVSQAALVGVSTLDAKGSGLGALRAALAPVKALLTVLYVLVLGATRTGRFGRALVSMMLASGGALLAVAALASPPPAVGAIGAALAGGAVLLAAVRSRAYALVVMLAVALLAAVVVVFVANNEVAAAAKSRELLRVLATVFLLVAATWAVGMARDPRQVPGWFRGRLLRPFAVITGATVLVLAARPWERWQEIERIVLFELAATPARAARMMSEWGPAWVRQAKAATWADMLFAVFYAVAFLALAALVTELLRRGRDKRLTTVRPADGPADVAREAAKPFGVPRRSGSTGEWLLARGPLICRLPAVAAGLDIAENVGMLALLIAGAEQAAKMPFVVPAAVAVFAVAKFALLALVLAFALVGLPVGLAGLLRRRHAAA